MLVGRRERALQTLLGLREMALVGDRGREHEHEQREDH
jgi:hypothetical protein